MILLVGWGFAFWSRGGLGGRHGLGPQHGFQVIDWWIELLPESSKVWAW